MHIEVIINARWNSFSHCFLINVSMIIISDNHISSSSRGLRTEFRLHKFLSSMEFLSLLRGKIQAGKNLWHRGEFEWYQQQSTYKKSYHSCYTNLPKSSCKVMTYFFCSYLPTPFMWRFGEAFLPATKTRGTKLRHQLPMGFNGWRLRNASFLETHAAKRGFVITGETEGLANEMYTLFADLSFSHGILFIYIYTYIWAVYSANLSCPWDQGILNQWLLFM